MFRYQYGEINNLVFIDPQVVAHGNGIRQGLVAGENSGNITVVWQGGRMEHKGNRTVSGDPELGVVGWNTAEGWVKVMAQDVIQTAMEDHVRFGTVAGVNQGTVLALAHNISQTARGDHNFMAVGAGDSQLALAIVDSVTQQAGSDTTLGIAAGYHRFSRGRTPVRALAHRVTQMAGFNSKMGIGAGFNEGISQAIAHNVDQNTREHNVTMGIGGGRNLIFAQALAVNVNQTGGYYIGIGGGYNHLQAQAVVLNRNQVGISGHIGISGGRKNPAYPRDNEDPVTPTELRTFNLTQLGFTKYQKDWTVGSTAQYPMLVDLDGGYQDMQRLSAEFRRGMKDFAPPSNNLNISWFDRDIWTTLKNNGMACPDTSHLPMARLSGTIRHMLHDSRYTHEIFSDSNDLAYWASYDRNDNPVPLTPCFDIYTFTGLGENGVVVDAVTSGTDSAGGDNLCLAYHLPRGQGSQLARYTLAGNDLLETSQGEELPGRALNLFYRDNVLYLVTGRRVHDVTRPDNPLQIYEMLSRESGEIRAADVYGGLLYLVTEDSVNQWWLEFPNQAFSPVLLPGGLHPPVLLRIMDERIHVAARYGRQVRWLSYHLDGEPGGGDRLFYLPRQARLANLMLTNVNRAGDVLSEPQLLAMGRYAGQSWWEVLQDAEVTEDQLPADYWPAWLKAAVITGSGIATLSCVAVVATLGYLGTKIRNQHKLREHRHTSSETMSSRHRQSALNNPYPQNRPLPAAPFYPGGGTSDAVVPVYGYGASHPLDYDFPVMQMPRTSGSTCVQTNHRMDERPGTEQLYEPVGDLQTMETDRGCGPLPRHEVRESADTGK